MTSSGLRLNKTSSEGRSWPLEWSLSLLPEEGSDASLASKMPSLSVFSASCSMESLLPMILAFWFVNKVSDGALDPGGITGGGEGSLRWG